MKIDNLFKEEINPSWPLNIQKRVAQLNQSDQAIKNNLNEFKMKYDVDAAEKFYKQSSQSKSNDKKLFWLRREAHHMLQGIGSNSACHSECSHCCHMGVLISEVEAKIIGTEIGKLLQTPPDGKYIIANISENQDQSINHDCLKDEFIGQRCPFLNEHNKCSIYASRPIVCRNLVNLDQDSLLCELVKDFTFPVPYLNRTYANIAYIASIGVGRKIADIRYFFNQTPYPTHPHVF